MSKDDPLDPVRQQKKSLEQLADQDRDDNLDALARCLLAVADGQQPDKEDCRESGLTTLADELEK